MLYIEHIALYLPSSSLFYYVHRLLLYFLLFPLSSYTTAVHAYVKQPTYLGGSTSQAGALVETIRGELHGVFVLEVMGENA